MEFKFGNPRLDEKELAVNPRCSEDEVRGLIDLINQSKNKNIDPKTLSKIVELIYYYGRHLQDIIETEIRSVLTPEGNLKPEYQEALGEYLDYIRDKFPASDDSSPLFPGKKGKRYAERTLRRHFQDVQNESDQLSALTLDDIRQAGVCHNYHENLKKYAPQIAFDKTMEWSGIKQRRALRDYMQANKGERQGGDKKPQEDQLNWFKYKILEVADGAWDSLSKAGAEVEYEVFVKKVEASTNKLVQKDAEKLKRNMRTVLDARNLKD